MKKIFNNRKSQKISILKMTEKDLPLLFKLGKANWQDDTWLTMSYLKNSFRQPGLSYTAKSDGLIIGGIIMVYEDIVKNWIRYLIIDKEYRRRGVGRLLLKKMLEKIKPGEAVFVDTGVNYRGAVRFYEKMGFKNCGLVKGLYGDESAYFFKKIKR